MAIVDAKGSSALVAVTEAGGDETEAHRAAMSLILGTEGAISLVRALDSTGETIPNPKAMSLILGTEGAISLVRALDSTGETNPNPIPTLTLRPCH